MIKEALNMTDNSVKNKLRLTREDFDHMAKHFKAYKLKGKSAGWIDTPWGLTASTKDFYKLLRHYMVATLLGWDETATMHSQKLKELEVTKEDIATYSGYLDSTMMDWKQWFDEAVKLLKESVEKTADVKDLTEDTVEEDVEKHAILNPKLYAEDNLLKDEVREKILQMVNVFTEGLEKDGIKILVKDIILLGSNANYNYTKDSDIDIHIITDLSSVECPEELYSALYSAYRSIFNKKFDIEFYGIPVELYVETEGVPTVSNGIYSVKENEWLKEPVHDKIPDIDKLALAEKVAVWQERGDALVMKAKDEASDPTEVYEEIKAYIEEIYELRKTGLKDGDEYSLENLTFKEVRNIGMLDDLKALKDKMTSKILSLESLNEMLDEKARNEARIKIARATGTSPIVQRNGYFFIYNVKEADVDQLIGILKRLDCVEHVSRGAAGKYDFSHVLPAKLPTRLYTINGKLKD